MGEGTPGGDSEETLESGCGLISLLIIGACIVGYKLYVLTRWRELAREADQIKRAAKVAKP